MSKRNITYVKPEEPSFLRKLKQQAGYKEGPTVDTKREDLGPVNEEDFQDTEEELPTVVVLKPGDLTADEAAQEKIRLEKEAEEAPADLNKRILFNVPKKSQNIEKVDETKKTSKRHLESKDKDKPKKVKTKTLLSFDEEENDD